MPAVPSGLLAAVFVTVFGTALLLLADDQQRVIDANSRLQERTVPEIIRYQRLARTWSSCARRGTDFRGEFACAPPAGDVRGDAGRQPSQRPGTSRRRPAGAGNRAVPRQGGTAVGHRRKQLAAHHAEWQRLAARLGMQVDDVSVEGINQATSDLEQASAAMQLARYKLIVVMVLVGLFLFAFIFLVRRHLIHPLQRIDHALSNLSADQPAPRFDTSRMLEIQAVEGGHSRTPCPVAAERREPPGTRSAGQQGWPDRLMNRRHFMQTAEMELAAGAALSPAGHRRHGRPRLFQEAQRHLRPCRR